MKKLFLAFNIMIVGNFSLAAPLGGNPTNGYCQTVDSNACGWSGNGSSQRQIINIPNRWGAIYYNAANQAVGYSENNTKSYESAREEALASCIRAGGGKNPVSRKGQGCHLMTEYRNACGAIAIGGIVGKGRAAVESDSSVEKAKQRAIAACAEGRDFKCSIRYAGCSVDPRY